MAKKIIIANWKMNLALAESVFLAKQFKKISLKKIDLIVCPSFTALGKINHYFKRSKIKLGAQNVFWEDKGAYTGEISPLMLKELGCQYVLLGHSERKRFLGEDYQMINKKLRAALAQKLIPIVCLGENWQERNEGQTAIVLEKQIKEVMVGVNELKDQQIIFCYEPFWAISTSGAHLVSPSQVEDCFKIIKHTLIDIYSLDVFRCHFQVIYGGTVNAQTIKDFLNLDEIKGFLVGTASLKKDTFQELIKQIN